ncbi:MAG: DUF5652 family protein [Candidatus Peribacteria bacterium]|nr:DUF5652 family protein [Candidatus Peribacteria bacterium]
MFFLLMQIFFTNLVEDDLLSCNLIPATFFSSRDFDLLVRLIPLCIIVALLGFALKIRAAWTAGRQTQLVWFICLLVFNTCGILPLIYLFCFQKKET